MSNFTRWTGGKKPTKFFYTYQDIAKLSSLTLNTVRTYASRGKFNPADLHSVITLITTARKWEQ
jgi:hypothetical protein